MVMCLTLDLTRWLLSNVLCGLGYDCYLLSPHLHSWAPVTPLSVDSDYMVQGARRSPISEQTSLPRSHECMSVKLVGPQARY